MANDDGREMGDFYPAFFNEDGDEFGVEQIARIVGLEFMVDLLWAHVLSESDDPIDHAERFKNIVLENMSSSGTLPEFGDAVANIIEVRFDAVICRLRLTTDRPAPKAEF